MNTTTRLMAAAALIALSASAAAPAFAHGDNGEGRENRPEWAQNEDRGEHRGGGLGKLFNGKMFRGRIGIHGAAGLESVRGDFKDMTPEEREQYRADAKEFRIEQKTAFETFVGLDKEELKEARKDGQSMGDILEDQGHDRDDTEVFLTAQGDARIDFIDDHHDLSTEDEVTLRARITIWIGKVLDRWFK